MIWMSNGMPPTSGHSAKVRGCCQALVPVDLSFLWTQQICLYDTPWASFTIADIYRTFLFLSERCVYNDKNTGTMSPVAVKKYIDHRFPGKKTIRVRIGGRRKKKKLKHFTSQCPLTKLLRFLFYLSFLISKI